MKHRPPGLPGAGELVNRATCGWYLDDLEEQCAKFRGFLAFAAGDGEAAMKHYDRIPKLDPMITHNGSLITNPNDYHRLRFGALHGYLVLYPSDAHMYSPRELLQLRLADFYYVTEQFDSCISLCLSALDDRRNALRGGERDHLW